MFALLATAAAGCITVPETQQSALQERIGGSAMSPAELRARVRDLASRFSGELEALADGVAAKTEDPATRLALTRFKSNAVSQMQMSLFLADPVAALVDAWALLVQIEASLGRIEARGELPPETVAIARARFGEMKEELAGLWSRLTGVDDVSPVQAHVEAWAAAHPFDSLAARESTVGLLAELSTRGGVGVGEAASFLLEDTQDLARRMDLISVWAPRQARWQAEIFVRGMLADPSLLDGAEDPQAMLDQLAELLLRAERIPAFISGERAALLDDVTAERLAAQAFVSEEREALVAALGRERGAVMAESSAIVDRAFDRATALADRILLYLFLLVALAGLLAIVAVLLIGRGRRPRGLAVRRRGEV